MRVCYVSCFYNLIKIVDYGEPMKESVDGDEELEPASVELEAPITFTEEQKTSEAPPTTTTATEEEKTPEATEAPTTPTATTEEEKIPEAPQTN